MTQRVPCAASHVLVGGFILLLGLAAAAGDTTLVEDGAARSVIVVRQDAPEEIERGARELQGHIEMITGARLPVLRPDEMDAHENQVRIHVGLNAQIKPQAPNLNRCELDGAWIKTLSDKDLLIAGRTPYGTEFGVYGFLQKFCGVRWYLPGPDGTHVPKRATLTIPPIDVLDNPFFLSREYFAASLTPHPFLPPDAVEMDTAWYRHNRMRRHFWCHHNLGNVIIPSKYGKEHPEYFPEINGKRYVPTSDRPVGFQPCMTNEDVIRICAEAALDYFKENPDEICFSIGVNDWCGYCQCANCRAANGGPLRKNSRGLPDYSRLYFQFANRVAEKLCDVRKDRFVGIPAYSYSRDMPEGVEFHPNVIVQRVAAFISYFNPMDRKDMERTRFMAQKCRTFGVYDYWYGTGYVIPVFCTGLMEEYIDFLAGLNVRGWGSETYHNWSMDGIKYYLLSQKLWTPSLRVKDLLAEYCRDMFDDGAADMLAFYDLCRDRWESQGFDTSKYHLQNAVQQVVLFDTPTCAGLLRLLAAAREKAKNPKGQRLLERFTTAIRFTEANARLLGCGLLVADQEHVASDDLVEAERKKTAKPGPLAEDADHRKEYAEDVLSALRTMQEIEQLRTQIRQDAFSLPRSKGLAHLQGLFETPETIVAPFLMACHKANDEAGRNAFLDTVRKEMPEFLPEIEWTAQYLPAMADQPELLSNGSFEELAPNRCDAKDWGHGDWGSGQRCNAFVVPQGTDGTNCYYIVGVKNVFSYMPYPAIQHVTPVPVEGGAWYVMQAKIRTHRQAGLLTMPTFHVSFPGALPEHGKCSMSPPINWFRAVWLFRAPEKAKTATVRFLGGPAQGQTWVDAMSLKRVPDAMAPEVPEEASLAVFPPLPKAKTPPPPLIIDFSKPIPAGHGILIANKAYLKEEGPSFLSDGSNYIVLQVPWTFRSIHDIEVRVTASGSDDAALGVYAAEFVRAADNRWRKHNLTCMLKSEPLGGEPKTWTLRYTSPASPQRTWFYFYRINRKGTLRLHRVEIVPVVKLD